MGGEFLSDKFRPYCLKCNYKCEDMEIGFPFVNNGIFSCGSCKSIVLCNYNGFRLDPIQCPICNGFIKRSHKISPIYSYNPRSEENSDSFYLCPKCNSKKFVFEHTVHSDYRIPSGYTLLKKGQMVQGQYVGLTYRKDFGLVILDNSIKCRLELPDISIGYNEFIECEVIEESDKIYSCRLKFIRILDLME